MKIKNKIFIIILIITALLSQNVNADEINKFYTKAKDNINIKETINGDAALAGETILINGKLNGISFIAGNKINIKGNLNHGFIAGNEISILGQINNSLYATGNKIELSQNSKIIQDAFLAGEKVILNGLLNRDVNIIANTVIIKEKTVINNNITINSKYLVIEDNVTINKTLKYKENTETLISDKSVIGNTEKLKKENNKIATNEILKDILNLIITFSFIVIIFPKTAEKIKESHNNIFKNCIKNIITGLLLLITIPLICILLLMSNIGISLGLILTALYTITLYLSYISSGYILGNFLLIKKLKININDQLTGILGIIIIKLLTLIPFLGTIITILAISLGISNIWYLIPNNKTIKIKNVNKEKRETNKVKQIKKNSISK